MKHYVYLLIVFVFFNACSTSTYWSDVTSPEFKGSPFTRTFVYSFTKR